MSFSSQTSSIEV